MVTQPSDADLLEKIEAVMPKIKGQTPLQLAMIDICIRLRHLLRNPPNRSAARLNKPKRDRAAYMRAYRLKAKDLRLKPD